MHPLDRLEVYGQARRFAEACRQHTQRLRDRDLLSQLLRAARSIAANLAEGAGSESQATFAKHIAIALASARETQCHLDFARDAGGLTNTAHRELTDRLNNLAPRLIRLLAAVRANAQRRARNIP
jgi:four helix bundle protein